MDNKTTAKHMESSIRKWRGIRENVRRQREMYKGYVGTYWGRCGYCVVFCPKSKMGWSDCDACPLYLGWSRKYHMFYCYTYLNLTKDSVASRALRLADNGHWAEALQHVDCLLAKMGRDLRKAGSKC